MKNIIELGGNMAQVDWERMMGINRDLLSPEEQAGLATSYSNLLNSKDMDMINNPVGSMTDFDKGKYLGSVGSDGGLFDGITGKDWLGAGIAGVGLVTDFMNYGLAKDAYKLKEKSINAQLQASADAIANKKNIEGDFKNIKWS